MRSYEAIAETRPRMRRDVLYTRTDDGVIFHAADAGFRVSSPTAYRVARLLVPRLTGESSVAELLGGLGAAQREMLSGLIAALYERDYARDAEAAGPPPVLPDKVAEEFAAQIAYVDHYCDDRGRGFTRFREARIRVLGDDATARWCALGLRRNGAVAVIDDTGPGDLEADGYDAIVLTGRQAGRRALALLEAGVPDGTVVLPAWRAGSGAFIGPVLSADADACWACAVLRLGAAGDPGAAADAWSAASGAGAEPPMSESLHAMHGNLLAFEAFRLLTGIRPTTRHAELTIQRVESLDTVTETVLRHPACPFHTPGMASTLSGEDLRAPVTERSAMPDLFAGHADDAVDELAKREPLVQANIGVFTRFDDEDLIQLPVKVSAVEIGIGNSLRRKVFGFHLHHLAGARIRTLDRAAEVYAAHVIGAAAEPDAPRTGTAPRVDPLSLDLASGLPIGEVEDWVQAWSMRDGRAYAVPLAAVHPLGAANAGGWFEPSAAGVGSGAAVAIAVRSGLASAHRFRALRSALRGEAPVFCVPIPDGPETEFLLTSASRLGIEPQVFGFGPALLARAKDPDTGVCRSSWGSSVVEALTELVGAVQVAQQVGAETADCGDPLLAAFDPGALVAGPIPPHDAEAAEPVEPASPSGDALVVPLAAPDLAAGGLHVVKVLLRAE